MLAGALVMKKIIFFVFLILFFLSLNVNSAELTFAAAGDIAPIAYEENGVKKGLCYDLFIEANKKLHLDVEIKFYPFERMWNHLKSGQIDGSIGIYYQKDREEWLIYSDTPMYYVRHSVFVKKGKEFSFNKIEDFYGKRIGRQKGWFITEEFEEAVREGKVFIDEAVSPESNLKKLNEGRIDVLVGNYHIFAYHVKELGLQDKIVALPKDITKKKGVYWAISKQSKNISDKAALMQKINKTIKEIHRNNALTKIENRYIR